MKRLALSALVLLLAVGAWAVLRMSREQSPRSASPTHALLHDSAEPEHHELQPASAASAREPEIPPTPRAELEPSAAAPAAPKDLPWCARLVDGETQAPLGEALLYVVEGDPLRAEYGDGIPVRADGTAELRFGQLDATTVYIACPGYASAFVAPEPGHGDASSAEIVDLWRAASVEVRVRDERSNAGGPALVQIRVKDRSLFTGDKTRSFGHEMIFEGQPGLDGTSLFEDLPAKEFITLEALDGEKPFHHEELFLEPGERRELQLSLGDGSTIVGSALTPDGKPVAGLEIWLVQRPSLLRGYFDTIEDTQARARTDARGGFVFNDVAPGEWYVGPAAKDEGEGPGSVDGEEAGKIVYTGAPIAPVSVRVTVQPDQPAAPVTLTCWSGLYIRGRVLDSSGQATAEAIVTVHARGILCDGIVDDRGSFTAGPLIPGEYTLWADCFRGEDSPSDHVPAHAGDENVELRLKPGGHVSVTVLDESRHPARAVDVLLVSSEDHYAGWSSRNTDANGHIEFRGVPSGRYALIAARENLIGVRSDFAVEAGVQATELELELEPGATLTIVPPEPGSKYVVRSGGWMLTQGVFGQDKERSLLVPAGEVVIELRPRSKTDVDALERRTVTTRAGETQRVEFEEAQR